MPGRYQPKIKNLVAHAASPMGGSVAVFVSEDGDTYYKSYPSHSRHQRISARLAREMVDKFERDCNEVPERLRDINDDLVARLRARTQAAPDRPTLPRMTNWGRQVTQS